jgi:hypothetical protein
VRFVYRSERIRYVEPLFIYEVGFDVRVLFTRSIKSILHRGKNVSSRRRTTIRNTHILCSMIPAQIISLYSYCWEVDQASD